MSSNSKSPKRRPRGRSTASIINAAKAAGATEVVFGENGEVIVNLLGATEEPASSARHGDAA